jgi:hypothetical protein
MKFTGRIKVDSAGELVSDTVNGRVVSVRAGGRTNRGHG